MYTCTVAYHITVTIVTHTHTHTHRDTDTEVELHTYKALYHRSSILIRAILGKNYYIKMIQQFEIF